MPAYKTVFKSLFFVHLVKIQKTKVTPILTEPQKGLLSTISAIQERITQYQHDLDTKAQVPVLGSDMAAKKWKQVTLDTRKQNVGSQIAAMNAATAQVGSFVRHNNGNLVNSRSLLKNSDIFDMKMF